MIKLLIKMVLLILLAIAPEVKIIFSEPEPTKNPPQKVLLRYFPTNNLPATHTYYFFCDGQTIVSTTSEINRTSFQSFQWLKMQFRNIGTDSEIIEYLIQIIDEERTLNGRRFYYPG